MDGSTQLEARDDALIADALTGLRADAKTLSPKWLYDHRGSALFEEITRLPEYYPTRTEAGILRDNATALARLVPPGGALIELGSGASIKTRTLLDAGNHIGAYGPIDISRDFLFETADGLRNAYPAIDIVPVVADFTAPVTLPDRLAALPKVAFFPGSTIGNLTPARAHALLSGIRAWPGIKAFILGADMVKDTRTLVAAYDDAQGVTAKFIGNILIRLNREADADFDPAGFDHKATWNAARARIDMHLLSNRDQHVTLDGHVIEFAKGEPIHVSAARKFTVDSLVALAADAGWDVRQRHVDDGARFSVAVLTPVR
ncbi:L-histidine N(alpha)-methyltransferase [Tateyamaria omphalii]|uniref:L-histidine N(Alpha)-methyltransferase n=2 Tax=Tateyamaria omphalii TaxID=299262 RepID=A0A1P8MQF0_9RHOB|nr:L-histidine N(alpha)-methyltransferase [Tateyamaria omphalii]